MRANELTWGLVCTLTRDSGEESRMNYNIFLI